MRYWIKVAGTGDAPFDRGDWYSRSENWRREWGDFSMFPRRPRVAPGDRFLVYAAGSYVNFGEGRFFAAHEVVSDVIETEHPRWKWAVDVEVLVRGPRLEFCPMISDIGVQRRSLGRHSHIGLTEDQGRRGELLLARAAKQWGSLG